jgi:NADH-quinone oxidoreductase subunit M
VQLSITALLATGIQVVLAAVLLSRLQLFSLGGINDASSFQFMEKFRWIDISGFSWIGQIKIDYFLGIDGLSVPMVLAYSSNKFYRIDLFLEY